MYVSVCTRCNSNPTQNTTEPLNYFFFLIFLWSIFDWHWLCGQYCWSIRMGVQSSFMVISSKCKSEDIPLGEDGQVLTLTPFIVFVRVQFLTVTPITGCSLWYLPRLPTLNAMTRSTGHVFNIYLLASPRETQSSPVLMSAWVILILLDWPIWIPSVFKLFPGALMVIFCKVAFLLFNMFMWKNLLFSDVMSWIFELVTPVNRKFCT